MTNGICLCGCGEATPISGFTKRARGYVKGEPRRFVPGHYVRLRTKTYGYHTTKVTDHPRAPGGRTYVHIVVAERALGRTLPLGAQVHHVDGIRTHNGNLNLVICQDAAYHELLHARARIVRAGGDPDTQRICSTCRQLKNLFGDFNRANSDKTYGRAHQCRACCRDYMKSYVRQKRVYLESGEVIQCACGCGREITAVSRHGRPRRFVHGHRGSKER